tara:strand:+ start:537 stop:1124 length:588 start_codon:yes stop_codon:yes gene_type:complete
MSVITKGKTFANGEQLTAGKLNQMLDAAVFSSAAVDNTKTTLSGGAITIAPDAITATEIAQSFLDTIYPIGSIYTNATNSTNPGTLLGFGTWTAFGAGRVPVGIDSGDTDFDTSEETGGNKTTTATNDVPVDGYGTTGGAPGTVGAGRMIVGSGIAEISETLESLRAAETQQTITSSAINVVQPYIVVYMWKRTA